jgi:hypothetical protein
MTKPNKSRRDKYDLPNNPSIDDWAALMVEWAKDVRDDIIRLEAAAGIPCGDPGDPPPWPPGGQE